MTAAPDPALLAEADQRLLRSVDTLSPEDLAAPSLLPDWSRAHVVAHLALNAEGLTGVLAGLRAGEPTPMYSSDEARDADIEELAAAEPAELRERLFGSTTELGRALSTLTEEEAGQRYDRTPGGRSIRVGQIPLMRWREVEIHHADLGLGYTAAQWPQPFSEALIDSMTKRDDWTEPFQVLARDLARTWQLGDGEGGPVVTGDAGPLGWWLTGRPPVGEVTSNESRLPHVPSW